MFDNFLCLFKKTIMEWQFSIQVGFFRSSGRSSSSAEHISPEELLLAVVEKLEKSFETDDDNDDIEDYNLGKW